MFGLVGMLSRRLTRVFRSLPQQPARLVLGGGELGHGLGALRDGVLGQLTGEGEADSGLDLSGRQGGLLVVAGQAGGLAGKALEDVVDERVQDGHSALADASVGVHLLQHLVDVGGVGLLPLLVSLGRHLLHGGLSALLSRSLGHFRVA